MIDSLAINLRTLRSVARQSTYVLLQGLTHKKALCG